MRLPQANPLWSRLQYHKKPLFFEETLFSAFRAGVFLRRLSRAKEAKHKLLATWIRMPFFPRSWQTEGEAWKELTKFVMMFGELNNDRACQLCSKSQRKTNKNHLLLQQIRLVTSHGIEHPPRSRSQWQSLAAMERCNFTNIGRDGSWLRIHKVELMMTPDSRP